MLAHLASRGWLTRVRHGLYSTVPLGATSPHDWREDPWIIAASAFSPCYIGGWTACNEWGLTEQLFRDVVVITQRKTRRGSATIQGTRFRVKSIAPGKHFGTAHIWRGQNRVEISDPARTLVDILDDPTIGGGARHVADVTATYFAGEHRNDGKLLDYTRRAGNRTVFKRLGYLVEVLGLPAPEIIKQCRAELSSGISLLDPSMPVSGPITKLWNLRLNAVIRKSDQT